MKVRPSFGPEHASLVKAIIGSAWETNCETRYFSFNRSLLIIVFNCGKYRLKMCDIGRILSSIMIDTSDYFKIYDASFAKSVLTQFKSSNPESPSSSLKSPFRGEFLTRDDTAYLVGAEVTI